jgi:hypothetical protein
MSRSFDGATTSLDNTTGVPVSTTPLTLVCGFKPAAIGSTQTLVALNTSGTGNHQFELVVNSSNQVQAEARDTATSQATTTGTVTNGAWNMCGAVYTSATSRAAYLNGELGTGGTPTTSRSPSGMNEIRLGKSRSGAGAFNQFANGLIAYVWIWNVALSEANLDALYNGGSGGVDPSTIQGANLVFRTDLLSNANPEVDVIGGLNLTVTAATFSSDDPFTITAGGQPSIARLGLGTPGVRIGGQTFGRGW